MNDASAEKLRGGFYTPEPIAAFILKWGLNGHASYRILEPSCGDGMFLKQLKKHRHTFRKVIAVEFDEIEAEKAEKIDLKNTSVIATDFHAYCNDTEEKFDIAVGNPPYIRYQYFDEVQQQQAARIFERAGLRYTKLTNAWVSFIVGSTLLLKEHGKIGFVVPAEILQVSYAQQLREFLARVYNSINIISFEKLVFPNIQQEVVLLLCEKNGTGNHLIEHLELKDASELKSLDVNRLHCPHKQIDFRNSKWTFYFLEQDEIDFLETVAQQKSLPTIGDYANVEVGITTGANNYFTVSRSVVEDYSLQEFAKPLVGRSVQVNSLLFDEEDWQQNRRTKARAHFLIFPPKSQLHGHSGAESYISMGESQGIHTGYKTRIRDDWFVVPSIKLSDALFIRRNNLFPRLILNKAGAYTTDTMHRVFVKPDTHIQAFVASFYNSLSFAFAEISGRSYGGGVLELMPGETEHILLPYKEEHALLLEQLDHMMRDKKNINDILAVSNAQLLKKSYGFTDKEIDVADTIWKKLSARRLHRKK